MCLTPKTSLFLSVIEHGSFSAAARVTGRVPSAVGMAIAGLEAELDFPLFDRGGREPKPTAQALSLVPQARQVIAKLQELNAHALELSEGLEDGLTLVIVPELLSTPWAASLKPLSERYPLLELQVITAPQHDAVRMVQERLVDMTLVYERNRFNDRERSKSWRGNTWSWSPPRIIPCLRWMGCGKTIWRSSGRSPSPVGNSTGRMRASSGLETSGGPTTTSRRLRWSKPELAGPISL